MPPFRTQARRFLSRRNVKRPRADRKGGYFDISSLRLPTYRFGRSNNNTYWKVEESVSVARVQKAGR
jgi:hypothetical protein